LLSFRLGDMNYAYVVRRLLASVPTLVGLSIILFGMIRLLPGDAALLKAATGENVTLTDPALIASMRSQLGLDKPVPVQYLQWVSGVVRGDMGRSYWTHESAVNELVRRLPITIELVVGAVTVSVLVGIMLGVLSGVYHDRIPDHLGRVFSIFGLSIPNFWVGTLIIVLPAIWFGYLPPLGYVSPLQNPIDNFRQFIAPCLALGWALSASTVRITRSQMLEVLGEDYIRTARSKGLRSRTVIYRHAIKNALIPVITVIGVQTGFLLGGTVAVESVYGLPGVGTLTITAINQRDYPIIKVSVLFLCLCFVLVNLVVDLAYGVIDPRVRVT
jgi:peptide/nickel transport system permease protein